MSLTSVTMVTLIVLMMSICINYSIKNEFFTNTVSIPVSSTISNPTQIQDWLNYQYVFGIRQLSDILHSIKDKVKKKHEILNR